MVAVREPSPFGLLPCWAGEEQLAVAGRPQLFHRDGKGEKEVGVTGTVLARLETGSQSTKPIQYDFEAEYRYKDIDSPTSFQYFLFPEVKPKCVTT